MRTIIKKSDALFFVLVVVSFLVSLICSVYLPDRFFNDTIIIVYDKYNEIGWVGSYPLTILFYKLTLMKHLPFYLITAIQLPLLFYILYRLGIPSTFARINPKNIIIYLGFLLIAVFMCMPSKEFLNYIYIYIILRTILSSIISKSIKIVCVALLFALFAFFFRPYYLFVPIIALGMFFIKYIKINNKTAASIFYGILIAIFLSLSHGVIKGKYLSESTRDGHNAVRVEDANSMIIPPLETDTWYGEATAIVYGFFAVNIPVDGFKYLLSPQIIAFVLWQLMLFYMLFVRLRRVIINPINRDYEELWILLLLFAYFIVQGIFEPDLGSAIRHKIGVFPLIYYSLYYENLRKNIPKHL